MQKYVKFGKLQRKKNKTKKIFLRKNKVLPLQRY